MANQAPTQIIMSNMTEFYICRYDLAVWPTHTRATPNAVWKAISVLGTSVISDAGVKLAVKANYEEYSGQTNFVQKAVRTLEEQIIEVELADSSGAVLSIALNGNSLSTSAAASGVPGMETLNSYQGDDVNYFALLMRGASPYSTDPLAKREIRIPKCYNTGELSTTFKRGVAMVSYKFKVVRGPNATDSDADVLKIVSENVAPL